VVRSPKSGPSEAKQITTPEARARADCKKKTERPRTSAEPIQKAPTHLLPPTPPHIFLGVSQQVEFKNTKKTFFVKQSMRKCVAKNKKKSMLLFP
jgi:hypothetical protein